MTVNTDGAPSPVVMGAIMQCAKAWDGRARIIGNVQAADIAIAASDYFVLLAMVREIAVCGEASAEAVALARRLVAALPEITI